MLPIAAALLAAGCGAWAEKDEAIRAGCSICRDVDMTPGPGQFGIGSSGLYTELRPNTRKFAV
jgi:hypothetical protein